MADELARAFFKRRHFSCSGPLTETEASQRLGADPAPLSLRLSSVASLSSSVVDLWRYFRLCESIGGLALNRGVAVRSIIAGAGVMAVRQR